MFRLTERAMPFHETAVISSEAQIGSNVEIGPFAVIGAAKINDNAVIQSHAVIGDGVTVGADVEIFPGALLGKEPAQLGVTARTARFERNVLIGRGCSIGPHAVIYCDVEIGDGTLIGDGASIREQCRIGSDCLISRHVTVNYNTRIGDRVKIMDLTHLTGNMTIEDDVFVSCLVATTNDNRIRGGYGDHVVGPVLRRQAIIGGAAVLLPGVEVGAGSFVGAGAVVTKTVPAGEMWAGNPARKLRDLG